MEHLDLLKLSQCYSSLLEVRWLYFVEVNFALVFSIEEFLVVLQVKNLYVLEQLLIRLEIQLYVLAEILHVLPVLVSDVRVVLPLKLPDRVVDVACAKSCSLLLCQLKRRRDDLAVEQSKSSVLWVVKLQVLFGKDLEVCINMGELLKVVNVVSVSLNVKAEIFPC